MPTPEQHALLSASSAQKWLNCTPSARLEEQLPDKTSPYAQEGRLAHEIAELKVRKFIIEPMSKRDYNSAMKKLQARPEYNEEMQRFTDVYLEYIKGISLSCPSKPFVAIEQRLDYSAFAPSGFGTGDCIIIEGDTLRVIDFKYGMGIPVSAADNPQLKLYALGAIAAYGLFYSIKTVVLTVVQPRLDSISEWSVSHDELLHWGTFTVKPKALEAYEGKGDCTPGNWCKNGFCRAYASCRARWEAYAALEDFSGKLPPMLSDNEVGAVLGKAHELEKWVKALEDYALSAILAGKKIPGWKAVEGKKSRRFDDVDKAFADAAVGGVDKKMLFVRQPLTLAQIEKMMGKKDFSDLLGAHVVIQPGKPTLTTENDAREPFKSADAAEDFAVPPIAG